MDNAWLKKLKKNFKTTLEKLKKRAKDLKKNISLLYRAYKHPAAPWYAKVITIITLTYALSPIDLIPDFIPILGYLDDLIIVPAGIALSLRLIPKKIIEECREANGENEKLRGKGTIAAIIIVLLWIWILSLILKAFCIF